MTTQPQRQFTFKDLDGEAYLIRRLEQHRRAIRAGVTDYDERRERIRYAIIEHGLEPVIIGRHRETKKPETYREFFERHYGEPLQPYEGKRRARK